VQYLLDIHNSLPIINYAGKTAGTLHVRVRSWIDKIDTQPGYISIDKETNIADFANHMCLMRIHVDNMRHLPKSLCSATYVCFKFFFHSTAYKTPRYCGTAVNPAIEHTIAIDQKITRDFVDYIRSGCIEMEVFGKRQDPSKTTAVARPSRALSIVGEPVILQLQPDDSNSPVGGGSSVDDSSFTVGGVDLKDPDNTDGNNNKDEANDEKDRLIAFLQHQVEEYSVEMAKKDKAVAQSKKLLSAAQLDKAQAEIRADRSREETLAATKKLAELEAALASANARIEAMLTTQRTPVPPSAVVAVIPKSTVCVVC
jgi:hypothetical protein